MEKHIQLKLRDQSINLIKLTFVIVINSVEKNTPFTPSMRKSSFASGEFCAEETDGKSAVPLSKTLYRIRK